MTQTVIGTKIICPLCGSATTGLSCQNCEEDLTALHQLRCQALRCYNLGLRLAKHKTREAEECLNLAITLDAGLPEPYIVLGKLCARQKRYPEAITHWQKALRLDADNKDVPDCLRGLRSLFAGKETLRLAFSWQGKPLLLGSKVQDAAGRHGKIWRLLPDSDDAELTHIVVWTNSFFPEDIMIPVEYITDISDSTVFIGDSLRNLVSRMPRYRIDNQ